MPRSGENNYNLPECYIYSDVNGQLSVTLKHKVFFYFANCYNVSALPVAGVVTLGGLAVCWFTFGSFYYVHQTDKQLPIVVGWF